MGHGNRKSARARLKRIAVYLPKAARGNSMNSRPSLVEHFSTELMNAVEQVKSAMGRRNKTEVVLDGFWKLSDLLHRLLAHVSDHPEDCVEFGKYSRGTVSAIFDLLRYSEQRGFGRLPAIASSCSNINRILIEFEQLKQTHRFAPNRALARKAANAG